MDKTVEENLVKVAENTPKVYDAGKTKGFEEGKQAEYDAFWDAIQNKGNPTNYNYAFAYGRFRLGGIDMYNPKYDIKIYDNVAAAGYNIYSYSSLTDTKVAIYANSYGINSAFSNCTQLKRVPKLVIQESASLSNAFLNCTALEELNIEGTIGKNGLNLQWSTLLTHDSLMSVINALADKTADTSGTEWIVTIGETNLAKLTAEEIDIAHQKGWLIV